MRRLLDTSAYVGFRKGDPATMRLVAETESIDFSIIVIGELFFGFRLGSRATENIDDLDRFLDHPRVAVADVTRVTADRFGRISAALRQAGTPIPTNDVWIAAQAMELGSELVTFDNHFERVPGLVVTVPGG